MNDICHGAAKRDYKRKGLIIELKKVKRWKDKRKAGRKPFIYGSVCIYEGTNVCMCEMRMQIRKSVSFLSFLFNSRWQGRVDN